MCANHMHFTDTIPCNTTAHSQSGLVINVPLNNVRTHAHSVWCTAGDAEGQECGCVQFI